MKKKRRWKTEEDMFVRAESSNMSAKQIAEILDRTEKSVQGRLATLGLTKSNKFDGDSETHKVCRSCLKVLPRTSDYFNSRSGKLHSYCKDCHSFKNKEAKILRKLRTQEKEKQEFVDSVANQKYICKRCKSEKLGKEMKIDISRRHVTANCRACESIRRKELNLKAIEKMDFSLKKGEVYNDKE